MKIKPSKNYMAYFNRLEITMKGECVTDCSAQGAVDDAVEHWKGLVKIRAFDPIRKEWTNNAAVVEYVLPLELKEYGAWDADELADHDANLARIIWLAACDIKEES